MSSAKNTITIMILLRFSNEDLFIIRFFKVITDKKTK